MKKLLHNILVLFIIFNISNATILGFPYVMFALGAVLFLFHIAKKKEISRTILILSFSWIVINIGTSIVFNQDLDLPLVNRLLFLYIITPYLIIYNLGLNFWYLFEKWVFRLTLISLILFPLNVINMTFFNSLKMIFDPLTREVLRMGVNYWSSGVYTNAVVVKSSGLIRNCGFMWEPGWFAFMIVFAMVFNWLVKGTGFNKRFFVYLTALITTFSTSGYFAFGILLGTYFIKRITILNTIAIVLVAYFFMGNIYKLDFMSGKINSYIDDVERETSNYSSNYNAIKLNRFQIAIYDIKRIIYNPLGYGVFDRIGFEGIDVTGTNGLSSMLRTWGIFIFIFFLMKWRQFFSIFNLFHFKNRVILSLFISILIMIFSNPVEKNIFPYLLLGTSIVYSQKKTFLHEKKKYGSSKS